MFCMVSTIRVRAPSSQDPAASRQAPAADGFDAAILGRCEVHIPAVAAGAYRGGQRGPADDWQQWRGRLGADGTKLVCNIGEVRSDALAHRALRFGVH